MGFSQSMTIISVERPREILTSDNVKAFQLSQWNYIISKLRQIQVSTWNPDSKPFISVFTSPQPFVHYRFSKENPDIILRTGPLGDNMLVSERWQVSPWFVTAMMVMTQGWVRRGIKSASLAVLSPDWVAVNAREHRWHPPKSLDSDENFKPGHTLFCRKLRFVAIYALFGNLWAKKCLFGS